MTKQDRTPENKKRLTKMWVIFTIANLGILGIVTALAITSDLLATISVAVMGLFIANGLIIPRLRRAIRDEPEPEPDSSASVNYDILTDHSS